MDPDNITSTGYTPFETTNTIYATNAAYDGIRWTYEDGTISFPGNAVQVEIKGINPVLYFKYIKSKFKTLEKINLNRKLDLIKKATEKVGNLGQSILSDKFRNLLTLYTVEAPILAKGLRYYLDREDLYKHKSSLKEGHISDTKLQDYTRVIPPDCMKKIEKVKEIFDDIIIFHYWNDKQKDVKKMDREEKTKMKDPVAFGTVKGSNRYYFICDWEDKYCDLTFSEMVNILGKDEDDCRLNSKYDFKQATN